jgi:hypothetical protein
MFLRNDRIQRSEPRIQKSTIKNQQSKIRAFQQFYQKPDQACHKPA